MGTLIDPSPTSDGIALTISSRRSPHVTHQSRPHAQTAIAQAYITTNLPSASHPLFASPGPPPPCCDPHSAPSMTALAPSTSSYIPPHLRDRPTTPSNTKAAYPSSLPTRPSHHSEAVRQPSPQPTSAKVVPHPLATRVRTAEEAGRENGHGGQVLHVFGDSFTGPFKLLKGEDARVVTYKGASAKVGSCTVVVSRQGQWRRGEVIGTQGSVWVEVTRLRLWHLLARLGRGSGGGWESQGAADGSQRLELRSRSTESE